MRFKDFYFTFDINLKKPMKEIYENIDKKIRWSIRKAEKLGVSVNLADKNDFEEFCKEYGKYGYVRDIKKELTFTENEKGNITEGGNIGKLFVAKYKGKVVGGIVTKFVDNESIFSISFVVPEYKNFEINSLLLWKAIEESKKEGYDIFSLGGVAPKARKGTKFYNIYSFKKKWGGELKKRYIYSKNPLYILGRKLWKIIKNFVGK